MTYLPPNLLDGADRADADLDEQRDVSLEDGLDALSRAAFTPWPPERVGPATLPAGAGHAAGESTGSPGPEGGKRPEGDAPRFGTSARARLLARRLFFTALIAYAVLAYLAITLYVLAEWPA